MRFEMIEFIARVAVLWAERKLTASPVAGIHILGEELFKNNLPAVVCGRWGVVFDVELIPAALEKQALMNADDFRKYRLYNARAHRVLAKNQKTLRTVFQQLCWLQDRKRGQKKQNVRVHCTASIVACMTNNDVHPSGSWTSFTKFSTRRTCLTR